MNITPHAVRVGHSSKVNHLSTRADDQPVCGRRSCDLGPVPTSAKQITCTRCLSSPAYVEYQDDHDAPAHETP